MPFQLRPRRNQRNRRKRPTVAKEATFTAEFTTPNVTLTFDVPVVLKGIPQIATVPGGILPTSASMTDPFTVVLAYTAPGALTHISVPERDPGVRTSTGGFMPGGTFPAS